MNLVPHGFALVQPSIELSQSGGMVADGSLTIGQGESLEVQRTLCLINPSLSANLGLGKAFGSFEGSLRQFIKRLLMFQCYGV